MISSEGKTINVENVFEKIKKNIINALLNIITSKPESSKYFYK